MSPDYLQPALRWLAGDPRPAATPVAAETAARIRAVQVNAIARNTPIMMMASIFNAIVLRIGLARTGGAALDLWTIAIVALASWLFYRQWVQQQRRPAPLRVSQRAIRRTVFNAFAFGLLWAAAPVAFFADGTQDEQLVVACICIGMIFGGAFTLSALPVAALAFLFPLIVGSASAISSLGEGAYGLIAGLLVVYTAVLLTGISAHASQLGERVVNHVADEEAAHRDFLTGLPNRLAFKRHLTRLLETRAAPEERLAIFYFDLDRFKTINDTKGHEAGDEILKQTARRLRGAVRGGDFIARLGGDEFVLVVENVAEDEAVVALAGRINEMFTTPFDLEDGAVTSTITIGVAFVPDAGGEFDQVLRHADEALYSAKKRTRGSHAIWQSGTARVLATQPAASVGKALTGPVQQA